MLVCFKRSLCFVFSTLLYSSEEDYKEPEAADEPDSKPSFLVELDVLKKSEAEVAAEPETDPEIEEPLVDISADLPVEFAMELVLSSSAVRVPLSLRSPDVYDHLQTLLEATSSQEFGFLMVQSTIGSVFNRKDLSWHVAWSCLRYGS